MVVKRRSFAHARRAAGYTQERLAERLGVDRSTVARWEAGDYEPQPWQRPRIAEAFGLSLRAFDQLLHDGKTTDPAIGASASPAGASGAFSAGYEQVHVAARESLAFVSWAEASNVSASALDHLTGEIGRVAVNYVHAPLVPLFRDLVGLRSLAFELLTTGRQYLQQVRELFFLAGTSCLLLAHASQNLGDVMK
ncbi:MAG: helix-turn-helix transcriptional regulator [Pseudonocardiaceae bacterium]